MKRRRRFPFNNRGDLSFSGWNPIHAVENWGNSFNIWADAGYQDWTVGAAKKRLNAENNAISLPLPDPNAAQQTALDAQTKQRKTLLASGGATGQGQSQPILGSDIHSLNLGGM
jgi:hypothetical protein